MHPRGLEINGARLRPSNGKGHYESWFLRANHPVRPLAFWIRYTLFAPRGCPDQTEGELWAVAFDGEQRVNTSVYRAFPAHEWSCAAKGLVVDIGEAVLRSDHAVGQVTANGHVVAWDLHYAGDEAPLLLLPERMYHGGFPPAKSLVARPLVRFSGSLTVDAKPWPLDGWVGSQNHNWGTRHTDAYAWGQVMGFPDAPEVVLECAMARNRLGPFFSPWLTIAVVRDGSREYRLNRVTHALRGRGWLDADDSQHRWQLESRNSEVKLRARFVAPTNTFSTLVYRNPPGGNKRCRNSKLAACTVELSLPSGETRRLHSPHGAAFELLGDL